MTTVMSFANFKGGVGKTSSTALTAWSLAKKGHKVLVVDMDPQSNLTSIMIKTKSQGEGVVTISKTIMAAIVGEIPLSDTMINIRENLDLVPSSIDLGMYPQWLDKNRESELDKVQFLKEFLAPYIQEYDYVFLDVPPTMSLNNDTAFYAADQIIIVLQTQERALAGADAFVGYLQTTLVDRFHSDVDILGILPVLSKRDAAVDREVIKAATKKYGEENIFTHRIVTMERIKRMDMTGITDQSNDGWDKKVHKAFDGVADEIIERLGDAQDGNSKA